jgi:hypothetical protein
MRPSSAGPAAARSQLITLRHDFDYCVEFADSRLRAGVV